LAVFHIVKRRVVDHIERRAAAQPRQKCLTRFARTGTKYREAIGADLRGVTALASMARTGVVDRDIGAGRPGRLSTQLRPRCGTSQAWPSPRELAPVTTATLAKFPAVEIQAIALGRWDKRGRGGVENESVKPLNEAMKSSRWSGPVKAVAGGPVASIASRWATGGGEAYTVRKQAVRIQLRHRFVIATPTPLAWRKGASRQLCIRRLPRSNGRPKSRSIMKDSSTGRLMRPIRHAL
jgi:hypothetical protein